MPSDMDVALKAMWMCKMGLEICGRGNAKSTFGASIISNNRQIKVK